MRLNDKNITSKRKGTPGFEPGTSRSAVECSTTELYPLTTKGNCNRYLPLVVLLLFPYERMCFVELAVLIGSSIDRSIHYNFLKTTQKPNGNRKVIIIKTSIGVELRHTTSPSKLSRDRIVVSTLRCGRNNPGSNPGHGTF